MAFHNRTRGSSLLFGSNIWWWVKTRSNLLKQSRNWCLVIQKDVTTELNSDRRAKDVKRRWFTTICDFSGWLGGANTSYELTWTDLNWLELTWTDLNWLERWLGHPQISWKARWNPEDRLWHVHINLHQSSMLVVRGLRNILISMFYDHVPRYKRS